MTTRLLEDRPETVWALLTEAAATPRWLTGCDALAVPAVDTPVWPEPGAQLEYRAGHGPGRPVVAVRVLDLQPGRRFGLALSRQGFALSRQGFALSRQGFARSRRVTASAVLVGIRLEPAPLFRTAVTVESCRFPTHHLRPGGRGRVTDRVAQRMLTDLVTELRHRGPVMVRPRDWTDAAASTRR